MPTLLALAIALTAGLLMTRVMKLLNLPNVTGYLIAGLIIGPFCGKFLSMQMIDGLGIITTVALGFVAFSIGGEFKLSHIKQIGGKILVITLAQAFAAVGLVMGSLFVVWAIDPNIISIPSILILSAIAAATAPAATLMVVKQFKARGPVTDALLPVVAFDDAIGLIVFSICLGIAKVVHTGGEMSFYNLIAVPLIEIFLSIAVGFTLGAFLALICRYFKSRANRLCWTIVCVLAGVALSEMFEMSSLLTCMMLGVTFANLKKDSLPVLERADVWTPPLFMLFFVLSGASLDISVIPKVGIVGIVYLIARSLGKYSGTFLSSHAVKADKHISNYLGIALLPQAGVAIGMMQVVAKTPGLDDIVPLITTVVLCATLVYEMVGPVMTKWALKRAGEISGEGELPVITLFKNLRKRFTKKGSVCCLDCDVPSVIHDDKPDGLSDAEGIKSLNLGSRPIKEDYMDIPVVDDESSGYSNVPKSSSLGSVPVEEDYMGIPVVEEEKLDKD